MGRGRDSRSRSRGKRSRSRGRGAKNHDKGTINTWNLDKQFGFVSCDGGGPDLFTHAEQITDEDKRWQAKKKGLRRGDRISFDIQEPQDGKKSHQAVNIEVIELVKRSRSPSRRRSRSRRSPRGFGRPATTREGDWECSKCGEYNFARNIECRKCRAPKPRGDSRGRGRSPSRRRRSPSRRRRSPSRRSDSRRR
eukprot:TRINITY_DN2646_c0_g1_i1.p1 TRINITY_DN2646_c0_g1~~TRINITY_DN2646_c0_g1_i1.p1  ORF type:complete len:194 (+),score=17.97 TRINITY_DN2646_c0_g1_i1:121-702(+)